MIRTTIAAALLAVSPTALLAQETAPGTAQPRSAEAEAEAAQETAGIMAKVLESNAIAQRQFAGMTAGAQISGLRGAVSMPGDKADIWLTTIVGQENGAPDAPLVAMADYEIANGVIRKETIYEAGMRPVLEGDLAAMARAQIVAPRAVIASPTAAFCRDGEEATDATGASVTFLTIALPPREDASFDAYVLNGPFEGTAIPLGKHYRISFDEYGQVGEPELLTDNCEVVSWDADDPDLDTKVYVTDYSGSNAPSAVHAFLSTQLPLRLGVVTGDLIWPVGGGMIAAPVPAAEAGIVVEPGR